MLRVVDSISRAMAATALIELPSSIVAEASESFLQLLGLNADLVVGSTLSDVFGKSFASQALTGAIDQLRTTGEVQQIASLPQAAGGVLPLAATVRSGTQPDVIELELFETDETRENADRLVGSLFVPSSLDAPSALIVSDVANETIRVIHNNLTDIFDISRQFTIAEYQAITHPYDTRSDDEYLERRLRLKDNEYITFDQRLKDRKGRWRPVVGRVRVLERDGSGKPSTMLGLIFDASHFHVVSDALMEATSAIENAEEAERTRFGRELHDSISQLLLGARMSLQIASSLPQADLPEALGEIDSMIGAVQEEIRGLSFLLHPPKLHEHGLSIALTELCAGLRLRLRLPIAFHAAADLPRASEEIEYALYRVAQEALINVHQHACAGHVEVLLLQVGGNLELVVSDDGVGIAESEDDLVPQGVGTASMEARMNRIGGSLEFAPGSPGLTVIARVNAFAPSR